jgi:hypothetical protein
MPFFVAAHNFRLKPGHLRAISAHVMRNQTVLEAIARRQCLNATYNRVRMKLAPHILYTRNDALYVDAVALEKGGVAPREKKIGSFKIDGLSGLALANESFAPSPVFNPFDPKYDGTKLFMVES